MTSEFSNYEVLQCNLVKTFARRFFERKTSLRVEDLILAHLLKCEECRKVYKEFAKEMFIDFNVVKAAQNFVSTHPDERDHKYVKQVLISKYGEETYYNSKKSYEYAASTYDTEALKRVVSVSEMFKEKYNIDEDNVEQVVEFNRFLAKRICKQIDLLEKCYLIKDKDEEDDDEKD